MTSILPQISINYETTRANAQKLSAAADTCSDIGRTISAINRDVPGYWTGQASDVFTAAMNKWVTDTNSIVQEIKALSAKIIKIANEFEEAERRLKAAIAGGSDNAPPGSDVGIPHSTAGNHNPPPPHGSHIFGVVKDILGGGGKFE